MLLSRIITRLNKAKGPFTGLIDYNVYIMPVKERLLNILLADTVIFAAGYVFYRSFIIALCLCILGLFYPGIKTKAIIAKRKEALTLQFKELLYSLASSMSAGKSIEKALLEAQKDIKVIYPSSDAFINLELEYLVRRLEMNQTVELALIDFAERANIDDISDFADVFQTSKRAGGNLVEVITNTSGIINNKIEIREEITTIISAKKFEQKVLSLMPICILLLLSISAADYMSPVFSTVPGRLVMTVTLSILTVAYFLSKKIMNIKV